MTLKEKRLQILSLAMDINEKYGAIVFVEYAAHVNSITVTVFNEPWSLDTMRDRTEYRAYSEDKHAYNKRVKTHDEIIAILQGILENGIKKL